jgi:hypothetical protein
MKKPAQHLIAEVPRRQTRVELTIDVDLDDVRSHYCTLNQGGEVVERSRFRTTPKAIGKWFTAYRWIGFTSVILASSGRSQRVKNRQCSAPG